MISSKSSPKKIAKNSMLLYARMLIVMLLNLLSVRFVLNALGNVDYGIYNVIAGVITMLTCVSSVLSTATQRFYSYAMGTNDEERLKEIFSASINIYLLLALLVVLLGETIGLWFVNTQLVIPQERMIAANWIYQFSILSFIATIIQVPFSAAVFAHEDMGLFAVISLSECVLKFILAVCLVRVVSDRLIFYGLSFSAISIITLSAYCIVGQQKYPECKYRHEKSNKILYKELLSFSGWSLLSSSAGVGMSQVNTILTNIFFGPVVNASRAVALQVSSALSSFCGNIIMAIRPPMIKAYAEGSYSYVNKMFTFSNKIIFYSLLIIILPLFFEMDTVLTLWLKHADPQMELFCRLLLVYTLILALNNPIGIIIQATGKIKSYSTWVEIPTLLCMPATYLLFKVGCPAESTFYVMIVAIALSHLIRLICLKHVFPEFSYKRYLFGFVAPGIATTIIISSLLWTIHSCIPNGTIGLIVTVVICSIAILSLCVLYGFSKEERLYIKNVMQNR